MSADEKDQILLARELNRELWEKEKKHSANLKKYGKSYAVAHMIDRILDRIP